jgi:hypothetical protein
MAADIIRVDYTDETATLEAMAKMPMNLDKHTWPVADPEAVLVAGLTEEIGGALYIVDGGNVTPSNLGASASQYLMLTEDGDGTASVEWDTVEPTWDSNKLGFYIGTSKAIGMIRADAVIWYWTRYINVPTMFLTQLRAYNTTVTNNFRVDGLTALNGVTSITDVCNVYDDLNVIGGTITTNEYVDGARLSNGQQQKTAGILTYVRGVLNNQLITVPCRGMLKDTHGATVLFMITDVELLSSSVKFYLINMATAAQSSYTIDDVGDADEVVTFSI